MVGKRVTRKRIGIVAASNRLDPATAARVTALAAERFPTLRVAFNRLSDRVFFRHVSTPDKILRNL